MIRETLRWRLNRPARARLAASLRKVSERLAVVAHLTEQDFLAVGGKLEGIVVRTRAEADKLATLLEAMGGEREDKLALALDEVSTWALQAERAAGCGEMLADLVAVVRTVSTPLIKLRSMVRSLRVMGVMTRIESARLGPEAAGFDVLAGEITALAADIDIKSDAILSAANGLCQLLEKSRETAAQLERRQQEELGTLMAASSAGLEDLRRERERIGAISLSARGGYEKVAAEIGEVVVALQFHDSTRQRIEHVDAALTELAEGFGGNSALIGAAPAVQGVQLQAAQLNEARQSFVAAADKIRTDLDGLRDTLGGFVQTARELAGTAGGGGPSLAEGLERHFSSVGAAVSEWIASRRTLAEAAGKADRACIEMAGFISEIETVGIVMLRLALNAEIQAAQLARSGAVMETVAEGIREVSQEASESAGSAGLALRGVDVAARRLTETLNESADSGFGQAGGVASRIQEVVSELQSANAGNRRLLECIAGGGAALEQEIAALRDGFVADAVMSEISSACLESLDEVAATVGAMAGVVAAQAPAGGLDLGQASYTMHAEREVHASFTGAPPGPVLQPPSESDFGGNVELF
jgi:methyl-accepting chemotaxis protein